MDYKVVTTQVQSLLKRLFKPGDLIISYRESGIPGQMTPFFIRSVDKIELLSLTPFCVNNLSVYLSELTQLELIGGSSKGKILLTVKPCDVKSVLQIISDAQISKDKVVMVVYECDGVIGLKDLREATTDDFSSIEVNDSNVVISTMQKGVIKLNKSDVTATKCKEQAQCVLPETYDFYFVGNEKKAGKKTNKVQDKATLVQDSLKKSDLKKMVDAELEKCIRCNACRNICPACFCSDQCIMDKPKLVTPFIEKENTLQNNTLYHLIRFYHVAPNCTGCSECERVCPQNIKLSIFFKYLNRFTEKELGYLPGKSDLERQKLLNYRFGEDLV